MLAVALLSHFDFLESTLNWLYKHPDELLAVDTETTGLRVKDIDLCIGVSIAFKRDDSVVGCYFPVNHFVGDNISDSMLSKLRWVLEHQKHLVFQNAKFDLVSLSTIGIDCQQSFWDTVTISQLLDENTPIRKDLDSLAKHYLGKEGKVKDKFVEKEKRSGNQNITWQQMDDYAVMDAVSTYELAEVLLPKMYAEDRLPAVWEHKERLIRLLIKMEGRGVSIDTSICQEMIDKGTLEMARIKTELGMNPASHKDLTTLMIDKLKLPVLKRSAKTGEPSFDKSVMPEYELMLERLNDPTAKLVKEFRGWQKAVSASFKPYIELLSPDGRLRTNYRLDTARTGRFSSEQPNLQQVPKEGDKPWNEKTKSAFVPRPGYVLVNADYAQLELRLGTVYADEPHLKRVFAEGRDVFTEMSQQLGMTRQDTKTLTYSMQYGAGIRRIMSAFGVTKAEAERVRSNYFQTYPRFKWLSDICAARAEQVGKVAIWSGRYRHFQYASEGYKAMNSVIQGGAADIMECVMLALEALVDDEDECRMLLQIHDAIVFEIREDLVEQYIPLIKEVMEDIAGATGTHDFDSVMFAVDIHPDYGSKGWDEDVRESA